MQQLSSWIRSMVASACQGTTTSISERGFSRLVCFLAVVCLKFEKPSRLPPVTQSGSAMTTPLSLG
jgi:hypothetical protein